MPKKLRADDEEGADSEEELPKDQDSSQKIDEQGVPGWMKPPKPFPPRKLSVLPGYKRQGYQADQECGGGKYTGEWKDGQSGRRAARTHRPRMHACMLSSRVRAEA